MAETLQFPAPPTPKAPSSPRTLDAIVNAPPLIINGTLDPYTGTWNEHTAKHLLKRAMFAPNAEQIKRAAEEGLATTIARLFEPYGDPPLPINYNNNDDPNVPIGESWVFAPIVPMLQYHQRSIRAWQTSLFLDEGVSLREKMVLFWHNHFVTADGFHGKVIYQYVQLLRQNAFGNFRQLVKDITVNPLMLRYLNGAENNKNAPNENYARELLELFTIGKGPQAGPGDYTNYTEDDIKELARALTGWTIDYQGFENAGAHPPAIFRPARHDSGTKTLSHRFGNAVINNLGAEEYKSVVDIILAQEEVSRFMARKLYRWFVYYYIDDAIEANVIEPLAALMRDHDYDMKPVIEALLSCQHFYDENAIGCQIKSPVDFTASLIKPFNVPFPQNLNNKYVMWYGLHGLNATMQQDVFEPPSVAGWKAYYQEPIFYRNWINGVTLTVRNAASVGIAYGQINIFDRPFGIDVIQAISTIENATDPNALILRLTEIVLPWPLHQPQLDALKEVLIPGLPDFEWTVEYGLHLSDPNNEVYRVAVENRLKPLFAAIMALPEFQLQ